MEANSGDKERVELNSIENKVQEEEEEEEEALSLCDLPITEENQDIKQQAQSQAIEAKEDFDFGSLGSSTLTEFQMCAADEVFFQGQILPLRHSVSSESGLAGLRTESRNLSRNVSRSESMDRCHSGGSTTASSRSSSIRSHNSSSSGCSLTTKPNKPRRIRNQFHSHPSPTPQIRFSNARQGNLSHQNQNSTIWRFLRLGLVQTPEMALQDLKVRSNNSTNNQSFGSRNSTNSTSSSVVSESKNKTKIEFSTENKKKQRFFDRNGALFGGCKCSFDAVETVPSRSSASVIKNNTSSVNDSEAKEEQATKKTTKQAMSRHRTFEWLKQLSLEGTPEEA
ncbi:unnamed protein product [Ilex paraguariensis]|uniref:Uncharacterized protein n=1 Tax=Ilex paraguariensis TaxID=185542 RepID=A0ABC8UYZ8_9AQUA